MVSVQKAVLFAAVLLISLSPEFGCAKRNSEESGASLKNKDDAGVTVTDTSLEIKNDAGVSFKKFKFAASDSVCEIRISFTCPVAMSNPEALAELQKNFVKQAFDEKYAGLKPAEAVNRVGKDVRIMAEDYRDVDMQCVQNFGYSDTLDFSIPGFLQYTTNNDGYTCGAHGYYSTSCCFYNLADGKKVEPKDIFVTGWEQSVTKVIIEKYLKDKGVESLEEYGYAEEEKFIPNGDMLSYGRDGITFVYNTYVIAPYAEGPQAILLSWNELKSYLNKNSAIYPSLKF
jgi:hypothetical protein